MDASKPDNRPAAAPIRISSRSSSASESLFHLFLGWGAAVLLSLAGQATASELQVYPLRLTLEPKAPTGTLTVGNSGADETLVQIAVYSWSQVDGVDKLEPTREVLVNPPLFPLKPGAQQIARFGLRVPAADRERSYRFILQEVPRRPAPGASGLATLLKMSIPIFVPPGQVSVAMDWGVRTTPRGAELILRNGGTVHVQVRKLRLASGGQAAFDKAVNVYVLPGATRIIPLELDSPIAAGARVTIDAETDQTPFSLAVTAQAAPDGPSRP